jgi:hypothetical protein
MLSLSALCLAVLAVAPADARGGATTADAIESSTAAPARFEASLSITSGTPSVLPGLATGVTAALDRRLRGGPLFVSGRLQWTDASAANEAWIIDHHQFFGAAAVGLTTSFGAGRLWAEVGGGGALLYEVLSRHQIERIQAAGVPGGTESSLAFGPAAFGEVGIALELRRPVRAVIAGGPTLARTDVAGSALWRLGGQGRVGIAYDF